VRRIGSSVRVVLSGALHSLYAHPHRGWYDDGSWIHGWLARSEQEIREGLTVENILPAGERVRSGGTRETLPLSCTDVYRPKGSVQPGILSVVTLDLFDASRFQRTVLLTQPSQLYASHESLYVASVQWWMNWQAGQGQRTFLHKLDISRPHRSDYVASGIVQGHLLNQFSMDEHRGYLRIATTETRFREQARNGWENTTVNKVRVLASSGDRLRIVGESEDLAPGERIYSARFVGDKGYVVTFRQIDPLFTMDLSNPRAPRVVGELKVPGFSSYIHPLDDDHLLTIGQDATKEGRVLGVHVQVFDVSSPARPRRTAHARLSDRDGWSYSAAQWDHHAFTYDPHTGVLGVPMTSSASDPEKTFIGLVLMKVSKGGLEELGRISHARIAEITRERECSGATDQTSWQCTQNARQDWRSQIQRSIVMDETIFTISQLGIQATDLARPDKAIAQVVFARRPASVAR
jgi:hypothetical protein